MVNSVVILRAVVVVAAALAGAAVAAAPASAAPGVSVQLSPTSFDLKGGDSRALTVKLTNSGPLARISLTVTAPTGLHGDVAVASSDSSCSGSGTAVSCTVDIVGSGQKSVVCTLTAKNPDSLAAGQSRTDTSGTVSATVAAGSTTLSYPVTLHGPAQAGTPTGSSPAGSSPAGPASGAVRGSGTAAATTTGDPTASDSTGVSPDPSGTDAGVIDDGHYDAAAGSGALSSLVLGCGVVLVLAGMAIIVALVVRHRRDRAQTRAEWPAPAAPSADAALRPATAPVDPWDPYPDHR